MGNDLKRLVGGLIIKLLLLLLLNNKYLKKIVQSVKINSNYWIILCQYYSDMADLGLGWSSWQVARAV